MSRFLNKIFEAFNFKKETDFNYLEFERSREENPLIKQLDKQKAESKRFIEESKHILELSMICTKVISKYSKDIPQEDYAFYYLFEGIGAFLPISIKPFLQP